MRIIATHPIRSSMAGYKKVARTTKTLTPARSYRMRLRRHPYIRMLEVGFERVGECILYRGTAGPQGYVAVANTPDVGRTILVHRASYEKWHGPVPDGLVIDHMCHNEAALRGDCSGGACHHRRCVNPAHLRAVTRRENFVASPLTWAGKGART